MPRAERDFPSGASQLTKHSEISKVERDLPSGSRQFSEQSECFLRFSDWGKKIHAGTNTPFSTHSSAATTHAAAATDHKGALTSHMLEVSVYAAITVHKKDCKCPQTDCDSPHASFGTYYDGTWKMLKPFFSAKGRAHSSLHELLFWFSIFLRDANMHPAFFFFFTYCARATSTVASSADMETECPNSSPDANPGIADPNWFYDESKRLLLLAE